MNQATIMSAMTRRNVAMLLGAGISLDSDFPSSGEISSRVLSGQEIIRHTDGTYYIVSEDTVSPILEYAVQRNILLLSLLRLELERFHLFDSGFETNYEDLCYICSQIHDSLVGEYENPLVGSFLRATGQEIETIRLSPSNSTLPWEVHELFAESMNYIRDVTWRLLQKAPKRTDHLALIKQACTDPAIGKLDLFTLNHDTLLEALLRDGGFEYADGFSPADHGVRYWDERILPTTSQRIRLLKLHGSVDWFMFQPNDNTRAPYAIGMPLTDDIWHIRNPEGELDHALGGRPVFLAGTFNKLFDYTSGIFADLHCTFRQSLRRTTALVVSGYAFGDKGINTQMVEWMYLSRANTIYLVHPNTDACFKRSRGVIRRHWEAWRSEGRLRLFECGIADAAWEDLSLAESQS
jgi:hypothetical protein